MLLPWSIDRLGTSRCRDGGALGRYGANLSYLQEGRFLPRKVRTIRAIDRGPDLLLCLYTLPYYNPLWRNTLDAVQEIEDSEDALQKRRLARRFVLFKINERDMCMLQWIDSFNLWKQPRAQSQNKKT